MEFLANPFWPTLRGPLAHLARGDDLAVRFDPEVNVFAALPDHPGPESWAALANLLAPGENAVISRTRIDPPDNWIIDGQGSGVQYLATSATSRRGGVADDLEILDLAAQDAAEMAALTRATNPGPFQLRTIEQGGFIGIRDHGRLVSIAGCRCQFAEGVEISTVCTAEDARGRGYASQLVIELVRRIEASGRRAFLHTGENNPARRVYENLGFELVGKPIFARLRPASSDEDAVTTDPNATPPRPGSGGRA